MSKDLQSARSVVCRFPSISWGIVRGTYDIFICFIGNLLSFYQLPFVFARALCRLSGNRTDRFFDEKKWTGS